MSTYLNMRYFILNQIGGKLILVILPNIPALPQGALEPVEHTISSILILLD